VGSDVRRIISAKKGAPQGVPFFLKIMRLRYSYLQREFILLVIIFIFVFASSVRNRVWKNEYTLWKDVVTKSPDKPVPHINLGNAFIRRGAYNHAEKEFESALSVNARDTRALNGLAVVYWQQKKYDEAIKLFEILAADKPNEASFHNNLGIAYMEKGLLDQAIKKLRKTTEIFPVFPDAFVNLGIAYTKKGHYKKAKNELEKALKLSPGHREAQKALQEVDILSGNSS
jgi:tetratricopeptide (TPR) repeat protein